VWYLVRGQGVWRWLAIYLIVVHIAIPFVLLLLRVVKQSRLRLGAMAAIVFVGQWIFMYYQVAPSYEVRGSARLWLDWLMPLGMGGIWFATVLWRLQQRPMLPLHDVNHAHAVHLQELDIEEMAREESLANV
jgi:hypothetical protein